MKQLNSVIIRKICSICALHYGKVKNLVNPPWEDGFCDVCEGYGNKDKPKAVVPVEFVGGVEGAIFTDYKEPQP